MLSSRASVMGIAHFQKRYRRTSEIGHPRGWKFSRRKANTLSISDPRNPQSQQPEEIPTDWPTFQIYRLSKLRMLRTIIFTEAWCFKQYSFLFNVFLLILSLFSFPCVCNAETSECAIDSRPCCHAPRSFMQIYTELWRRFENSRWKGTEWTK